MADQSRILIIDDDPEIRDTIQSALKLEGYAVDTAENGKEAVEKSEKTSYDLALIDIRLPDCEGTQLLTQLKNGPQRMRKILLTGYPTLPNAIDAVNKNADGYLVKPVEVERIISTVKNQLRKQKEELSYDVNVVAEFIETRVKELSKTTTR